jgi:hypothetical protein
VRKTQKLLGAFACLAACRAAKDSHRTIQKSGWEIEEALVIFILDRAGASAEAQLVPSLAGGRDKREAMLCREDKLLRVDPLDFAPPIIMKEAAHSPTIRLA